LVPAMFETKPSGYSIAYALSLIVSISVTILYVIGQADLEFMRIFSNIAFAPVALAPVIVALETSRRYGWEFKSKLGFIWLAFLIGLFLWFLGEFVWAIYVLGFKIDVPYPSLADVFYLLGYPAFIYGLITYFMGFRPALSLKTAKPGLFIAAVVIALTIIFLYGPIITSSEGTATISLDLLYITLDLIILIFSAEAFILTLSYHTLVGGGLWKAWLFLALGAILNTGADLLFSYLTLLGVYYEGHPSELLYLWAYVAYCLAFYIHGKEL